VPWWPEPDLHDRAPDRADWAVLHRSMPPEVATGGALRQWMCRAHNVVNRSLDKPAFNCALVDARWGALYCGEKQACDLALGKPRRHS